MNPQEKEKLFRILKRTKKGKKPGRVPKCQIKVDGIDSNQFSQAEVLTKRYLSNSLENSIKNL